MQASQATVRTWIHDKERVTFKPSHSLVTDPKVISGIILVPDPTLDHDHICWHYG